MPCSPLPSPQKPSSMSMFFPQSDADAWYSLDLGSPRTSNTSGGPS